MSEHYMLFAGSHYYPLGGGNDFVQMIVADQEREAVAEAAALLKKAGWDWATLATIRNGEFVVVADEIQMWPL